MSENTFISDDEHLEHYGVKGMRWGVSRASKKLAKAITKEARDKAIAKLNKHKEKASKKIAKLDKKRPKLDKEVEKAIVKYDVKAAKLRQKALKLKRKSGGFFVSERRGERLSRKSDAAQAKSDLMISKSQLAKAKLTKNKYLTDEFKKGISNIDETLKKHKKPKRKS